MSCCGWVTQVRLLIYKNFLIRKRAPFATCFEILLPVLVLLILMAVRSLISIDDVPDTHYVDKPLNQGDRFDLSIMRFTPQGRNQDKRARIAISPGTDPWVQRLMMSMNATISRQFSDPGALRPEIVPFSSETAMVDYIQAADYLDKPQIALGVVFLKMGLNDNKWTYRLRANRTNVPFVGVDTNPYSVDCNTQSYRWYVNGGVSFLQHFIDYYIMTNGQSVNVSAIELPVYKDIGLPMPIPQHKRDDFSTTLSSVIPLFYLLAFLYPCARIVRNIVEEKEQRIKEGMRMMGLLDSAFWTSWYITYIIQFTLTALIIIIVGKSQIYPHSNAGIIFFYFLLFGISMVSYAWFISTFFSKSKIAGTVAYLLIFGAYVPTFLIATDSYSVAEKTWAGLLPPTAFGLGGMQIAIFESFQLGITNSTVDAESYTYKFSSTIVMFIVDIILYALLGWYLDLVIPSDYGTAEKPWFCCTKKYWCGRDEREEEHALHEAQGLGANSDKFEKVSDDIKKKIGVEIVNLRKVYPDGKVAVQALNLEMYEGQIFCLLGHNGAGKSTTVSMLTGMTEITAGDAKIGDLSVKNDMHMLRQRLGVCPQHDILFPNLTVKEHLELYAALKGVPRAEVPEMITQKIKETGLVEKTNSLAGSLSGGQKRKLSVAIAFMGNSKVVFLDEPTSGMDPYSRRATWDMLQKNKKDRVIVLTTHFMDEADILGDRIAIMAEGVVQCCGSSLFLKSLYGVGYTFVVTRNRNDQERKEDGSDKAHNQQISDFVMARIPTAEKLSAMGAEVAFRLPLQASAVFPALFREMDEKKEELKLLQYGISVTTLEEVFLRATHSDKKSRDAHAAAQAANDAAKQDQKANNDAIESGDAKELNVALKVEKELNRTFCEIFTRHFNALFMKRVHYFKRDAKAACFQLMIPVLFLIFGFAILQIPPNFTFTDYTLTPDHYNSPNYVPFNNNPANLYTSSVPLNSLKDVVYEPYTSPNTQDFSNQLMAKRNVYKQSKYGAYFFVDQYNATISTPGFLNTTRSVQENYVFANCSAYHALPVYQNMMHNGLYKQLIGDTGATITASVQPFPFTKREQVIITAANGFGVALLTVIAFVFVPASWAVFVVREREIKAKHLQLISGVSQSAYWVSTYCWDMVNYLLPFIASVIIVVIFDNKDFVGENLGVTVLAFLLYGFSVAPFTYSLSFSFESHSTAQTILILVYFITGLLLLLTSFTLSIIESTRDINDRVKNLFRLFPPFCLGDTMVNLATRELFNTLRRTNRGPWDMDVSGYNFIFMFWESVVFFVITLVLEKVTNMPSCQEMVARAPNVQDPEETEDIDVINERKRVSDGGAAKDAIVVDRLRKVYNTNPPKVAVRDLSYGIAGGECFGFLGINGAGKTTTISILSGEFPPTSGHARLSGTDVVADPDTCRRLTGYCPQFDALLDLLTAREHLELFARIKGVPDDKIAYLVNTMLDRMTLTQYADRPAGTYSGGNKRKLSVGLALVGDPPICFLDEPSTGMDPLSRRFMWDFISSTMKGRSVILTTHSMEECEALCHRLGIMVGGRLRCIGSTQHIKNRFGQGYQIDVNVRDTPYVQIMTDFVKREFQNAHLVEFHGNRLKFEVAMSQPLWQMFQKIETNKEALGVREYSIGQYTLEQIFIEFAKLQREEQTHLSGIVYSPSASGGNQQPSGPVHIVIQPSSAPSIPTDHKAVELASVRPQASF